MGTTSANGFGWFARHPIVVGIIIFGGPTAISLLFSAALLAGDEHHLALVMMFNALLFGTAIFLGVFPEKSILIMVAICLAHYPFAPFIFADLLIFYALFISLVRCSKQFGRLILGITFSGLALQEVGTVLFNHSVFIYPEYGPVSRTQTLMAAVIELLGGGLLIFGTWAFAKYRLARQEQKQLAFEKQLEAQRLQTQQLALAAADERNRIAREMHDVVAHSLSVVIAQADGGQYIAKQNPEQATKILETIANTSRSALADMRQILGVLRQDPGTEYGPQPTISDIPDLCEKVRAAGTNIDLAYEVGDLSLPPGLSLSIYRLVQEALTNVLKHAGENAKAQVMVKAENNDLVVSIVDDGLGATPTDGLGHGIAGMQERIALYHGTITAEPLPGRGFRVLAKIPLDGTLNSKSVSNTAAATTNNQGKTVFEEANHWQSKTPYIERPVSNPYQVQAHSSYGHNDQRQPGYIQIPKAVVNPYLFQQTNGSNPYSDQ